jgi:hypothetical protein
VQLHVGADPMPADEGWVCTFHPADEGGLAVELLRKLWQAAQLLRRLG